MQYDHSECQADQTVVVSLQLGDTVPFNQMF